LDVVSIIAIIGTVASIGGAVVAVWQAKRSTSAANEARLVRAQLIGHRQASELTQLHIVCKKAQKSMEKYGPGSVPANLHGISPEKDAQDVQEFLLLIKENRLHFGNQFPNEADDFCDKLAPILNSFAQAKKPNDLRQHGTQILLHLSNMTSITKKYLDGKREQVF